ncbi:MAG: MFS transporter [Planctomycetota bacterium]|nr:MFS transporter [Planctomycetota bacterium]
MSPLAPASVPFRLLATFVSSFHPRALRPMLRRNYARELTAWAFLPLMLACLQGGTMGVILKKGFAGVDGLGDQGVDYAVGAIAAAMAIGNLTSGIWVGLTCGRRKVPFLTGLMIATTACVTAMAFVPRTATGAWILVGLVILGWMFWSGVVTIRTTVWRANYPDADRATVAGRIATVQVIVMALAGLGIGQALDRSLELTQWIFPMLAGFGVIGALVYSRVRLRGQSRLARAERTGGESTKASFNPLMVVNLLRADRRYGAYMVCMMVFGFGNLMIGPTVAIILEDEFSASYQTAILVTSVIPLAVMPFAIPLWARLMSRMHVISFRSIHSWTFVCASLLFLLAVEFHLLPLMFIAAATLGIGFAGGMLAWNLGHQSFAPPHRDAQYMSVHVMLTGIRGLVAPFVGVAIYTSFAGIGYPGLTFAVALALNVVGALGFLALRRSLARDVQPVAAA